MFLKQVVLAAVLAVSFSSGAAAQTFMGEVPMMMAFDVVNQNTLNMALDLHSSNDDEDGRSEVSTLLDLGAPRMPRIMSEHYDAGDRAQARQVFEELLDFYGQVARQLDVPANDAAGAVAAFVAGSWMAWHDRDVSDEAFPVLVDQMRGILQSTPQFAQASDLEKQELHEQLAILGTAMAVGRELLKQQPSEDLRAGMRQAAHGYLSQFLNVDPDSIEIDESGLSIR